MRATLAVKLQFTASKPPRIQISVSITGDCHIGDKMFCPPSRRDNGAHGVETAVYHKHGSCCLVKCPLKSTVACRTNEIYLFSWIQNSPIHSFFRKRRVIVITARAPSDVPARSRTTFQYAAVSVCYFVHTATDWRHNPDRVAGSQRVGLCIPS